MRRADNGKHGYISQLMQMPLRGGMSLADLVCKVYDEQRRNVNSEWLFSIAWNELPPQWKPDLESDWKTAIGSQIQQVVGYYFFFAERDGNGHMALDAYYHALCSRKQSSIESARARFYTRYISGGGMQTARHFLLATKDRTVTSLIHALLLYVDAAALFKRPEILVGDSYLKPAPLPRMGESLGSVDSHLGLRLKFAHKPG